MVSQTALHGWDWNGQNTDKNRFIEVIRSQKWNSLKQSISCKYKLISSSATKTNYTLGTSNT